MIKSLDASNYILDSSLSWGNNKVSLENALGRVLAEDLVADRDFPPFNRVMMDGIAINYDAFEEGNKSFKIENIIAAGSPIGSLKEKSNCLEIMTGAVLPNGTDTVIRYEDLSIENGIAQVKVDSLNKGQNIHTKGLDKSKGTILVNKHTPITTATIGIAASIGKNVLAVLKLPEVAILSSGDELVDIETIPKAHQIRKSNVHQLSAVLKKLGMASNHFHLLDDKESLLKQLPSIIDRSDILILSGGVSKGKYDYIPEVMESLGFKKVFHRIKQRPGKPMWFGTKENKRVFALPGNPISSFLCLHKYVIPFIQKSLLQKPKKSFAILNADVTFNPDLEYFLEVKLIFAEDGKTYAEPKKGNGSGDLSNLCRADAFIQLPLDKKQFYAGEVYPIIPFV